MHMIYINLRISKPWEIVRLFLSDTPIRFWKGHNPTLSKRSLADYVLLPVNWRMTRLPGNRLEVKGVEHSIERPWQNTHPFWILSRTSKIRQPHFFVHPSPWLGGVSTWVRCQKLGAPGGFLNSSTSSSAWTGWNCNECTETDHGTHTWFLSVTSSQVVWIRMDKEPVLSVGIWHHCSPIKSS